MVVRIVSLVPHATELLFALGLGPEVVAVTHECDYPPAARAVERVTRDVLPVGLGAAEIDAAVRERTLRGEAIYELDEEAVAALNPDLIVTQALCPVCAVSYTEVAELAERMPSRPRVISLDPHTLGETLGDFHTLGEATGRRERAVNWWARQPPASIVSGSLCTGSRVRVWLRSVARPGLHRRSLDSRASSSWPADRACWARLALPRPRSLGGRWPTRSRRWWW